MDACVPKEVAMRTDLTLLLPMQQETISVDKTDISGSRGMSRARVLRRHFTA